MSLITLTDFSGIMSASTGRIQSESGKVVYRGPLRPLAHLGLITQLSHVWLSSTPQTAKICLPRSVPQHWDLDAGLCGLLHASAHDKSGPPLAGKSLAIAETRYATARAHVNLHVATQRFLIDQHEQS